MLQMVHHQTAALLEDLKGYELPSIIPRSPVDSINFGRTLSNATSSVAAAATAATVSTMLETAMEELFMPYTEGQRYLERESKSLSELYASFLTNFTRYHVKTSRRFVINAGSQSFRNVLTKAAKRPFLTAW
jgi:exocyst complex component 5